MIDDSKLSDVLDRVNLPELIERETKTKLKKSGAEFRGPCPVHGGKNPSAFVVHQKNGTGSRWMWHCYGDCNAGGDALTFIRKIHNLDFIEAVRRMCEVTGTAFESLGLTEQSIAEHKEREQRRDVLELAAQFYRAQFDAHVGARAYAAGRGFSDDTIHTAGFGYSNGNGLVEYLKSKSADLGVARQTGLTRSDGHDFTANGNGGSVSPEGWLIYIHRFAGRVEFLSARALNRETKDKSRNLPGDKRLYRANVRGDESVIIVEGQADAESWRQLGRSAWALCGVTLSDADAHAVRAHKPVYIMLDNDGTGHKRTGDMAKAIGPMTMISPPLPDDHHDPNNWLQAGATSEAANGLLKKSRSYIDLFIEESEATPTYEIDDRVGQVAALIVLLPDTLQGRYIKRAESALGVPAKDIKQRMKLSGDGNGNGGYSYSEIKFGMLHFRGDTLCNWAGRITHQNTLTDGLNPPNVRYSIEAKLAEGKPLSPIEVDAEEFETPGRWIPRHWGADAIANVSPSNMYLITRAIKEISRSNGMKRTTVYTFTGWAMIADRRSYLTAGGAINADGLDPNVRVELGSNRLAYYHLPSPPADADKLKAAAQCSLDFLSLAPLKVTAPLLAAMYGAPLLSVFSFNAVLWPYGPTQSGKSTLTMLALSHFGEKFIKNRDYSAPKDWMSTITDLEGAMFATKDMPLVIDDFAPQFTGPGESRDMHKKAHAVVRSVGNRSARGRANADLSERAQRPPRGIVIATAELPLSGQSIVGRMVYVPFERGDVSFSDGKAHGLLDIAQHAAGPGQGQYALAMAGYVQWLARNWEAVIERAKINHETANQYARTQFPSSQSRLMDYYADLITYLRVMIEYMVAVGGITQAKAIELGNELLPAALVDVLSSQGSRVAGQSPVVRLFEAVSDCLLSKRAYLNPRVGSTPAPPRDATLIGWWGHDEKVGGRPVVYLRLAPCLQLARDYWQKTGEGYDTTTDALQREIFQAKILAYRGVNEYSVSIWVAEEGKNVRCLAVDAAKIQDVSGVDLWPEQREMQGDEE